MHFFYAFTFTFLLQIIALRLVDFGAASRQHASLLFPVAIITMNVHMARTKLTVLVSIQGTRAEVELDMFHFCFDC